MSLTARLEEYRTYSTPDLQRYLAMLQANTVASGEPSVDGREKQMIQVLRERSDDNE